MNDDPSSLPDTNIPAHPEEVRYDFTMRMGKSISVQASARITPAGIVAAGVTTLLVALAVVALTPSVRSLADRKRRERR